jgi:hypothetical protein
MDLGKELELQGKKRKVRGLLNNHIEEISKSLIKGYTKKHIFDFFKQKKYINCNYDHFIKTLNKLLEIKQDNKIPKKKKFKLNNLPEKKSFQMLDVEIE